MKPLIVSSKVNISLKVKIQLNVKILIPLTPWPTGAWEKSYQWTLLKWQTGRVFWWDFWWPLVTSGAGQGSKPRPRPWLAALASNTKIISLSTPSGDQWSNMPPGPPCPFPNWVGCTGMDFTQAPLGQGKGGMRIFTFSWSFTFRLILTSLDTMKASFKSNFEYGKAPLQGSGGRLQLLVTPSSQVASQMWYTAEVWTSKVVERAKCDSTCFASLLENVFTFGLISYSSRKHLE